MSDKLEGKNNQQNPYHLGYLFHYPKFDQDEPFQLDISIAGVPTQQHYDPERVEMTVVSRDKERLTHLVVDHPWSYGENYQVCAGVIRMIDRKEKVEEALTFGANLIIKSESQITSLTITSPAPILKITNTNRQVELLRDEYEMLLAERRANWLNSPGEFEQRLIEVDPIVLYQSMLRSLIDKFEDLSNKGPLEQEVLYHLHTQIHRLEKAGLIAKTHLLEEADGVFNVFPKLEDVL